MADPLSAVLETDPLPPARVESIDKFIPTKYRTGDSLEQIQQDFRKAVNDLENRFKAAIEEMKRLAG